MPIFELQECNSRKVIYRQKVDYMPIIRWKKLTERKVLRMVSKEKFHDAIKRGDVVAGWADYDTCNPTEDDVQVVFKRTGPACRLILVSKDNQYGIIAIEGQQETLVKGNVMRYDRYKLVEEKTYSERDVIFGKSLKQVSKWEAKYFKE